MSIAFVVARFFTVFCPVSGLRTPRYGGVARKIRDLGLDTPVLDTHVLYIPGFDVRAPEFTKISVRVDFLS